MTMPNDSAKSYVKWVFAVAGVAIGWGIGQGIGASTEISTTHTFLVEALPRIFAFGGAAVGGWGGYTLGKILFGD
jgi:hypothetical protein